MMEELIKVAGVEHRRHDDRLEVDLSESCSHLACWRLGGDH